MTYTRALLIVSRLSVEGLNASTSPLTVGFPGPVTFYGLAGALEHKLKAVGLDVMVIRFGVVSHAFELQAAAGPYGELRPFLKRGTRDDDSASAPSFQETFSAHATLSLVFEVEGPAELLLGGRSQETANRIADEIGRMRVAGGLVLPGSSRQRAVLAPMPSYGEGLPRELLKLVQPGFALVDRRDLLANQHELSPTQRVAALMSWSAYPARPLVPRAVKAAKPAKASRATKGASDQSEGEGDGADIAAQRPSVVLEGLEKDALQAHLLQASAGCLEGHDAWVVPVPVGYQALTEEVTNLPGARKPGVPTVFAESLIGLAQFVSPRHLTVGELLWSGALEKVPAPLALPGARPGDPAPRLWQGLCKGGLRTDSQLSC